MKKKDIFANVMVQLKDHYTTGVFFDASFSTQVLPREALEFLNMKGMFPSYNGEQIIKRVEVNKTRFINVYTLEIEVYRRSVESEENFTFYGTLNKDWNFETI